MTTLKTEFVGKILEPISISALWSPVCDLCDDVFMEHKVSWNMAANNLWY